MDDLIILTGCDTQTEWFFPKKLKKCPTLNCSVKFKSRSEAINHYRNFHSNAILCTLCEKPIGAKSLNNVLRHYEQIHPNEDLPAYIKENVKKKKQQTSDTNGTDKVYGIDGTDQVRHVGTKNALFFHFLRNNCTKNRFVFA